MRMAMDVRTRNDTPKPLMTTEEVNRLMVSVYPQLNGESTDYMATEVFPGGCTVRLNADERHLRPGGTVSGPCLFTLADIGGYVCVLSHAGPDALSVTTNLNINFVRKAEPGPIDGHCRIIKLGRTASPSPTRRGPIRSRRNAERAPRLARSPSIVRVAKDQFALKPIEPHSTIWVLLAW